MSDTLQFRGQAVSHHDDKLKCVGHLVVALLRARVPGSHDDKLKCVSDIRRKV